MSIVNRVFELFIFTRHTCIDLNKPDAAKPIFYHCWYREAPPAEAVHVLGLASNMDSIMNALGGLDGGPSAGVRAMTTDYYKMHSFSTLSGYRFLLFTDPRCDTAKTQQLLKLIYEKAFVETVCKDPTYVSHGPVGSEAFRPKLEQVVAENRNLLV